MGGEIELYEAEDGSVSLEVRADGETVWLTQQQIAELFGTTRENVNMHLRNIYAEGELDEGATYKDFLQVRQEGSRSVRRNVAHYNLDVILSVGYRVKSKTATKFRRWSNDVLRRYLVAGRAENERRLEQLGKVAEILGRSGDPQIAGIAEVLRRYSGDIALLDAYDHGTLGEPAGTETIWRIEYDEARQAIDAVAVEFPGDAMFGVERGDSLRGILGQVHQTFGGQELYPSVQEKAANLLYLIVKDHPFADGNKRSAAALFTYFLGRNGALRGTGGRELVSGNTLAAITLMVAMSDPREKDQMVALVRNMLAG